MTEGPRRIEVTEGGEIPWLDIVFGFGPTVPFLMGDVIAWWFPKPLSLFALQLTILWGCAILLFLSGVRRGLSFRTEGGPTRAQLATMLTLFFLGLGSLVAFELGYSLWSLVFLFAGFLTIFVLDPIAARHGEAPLFFVRLRRLQMPIVLLALAICAVLLVRN